MSNSNNQIKQTNISETGINRSRKHSLSSEPSKLKQQQPSDQTSSSNLITKTHNKASSTSSSSSPLQRLVELDYNPHSARSPSSRSKSISAIDESLRSFQLLQALRSADSQSILKLLPKPSEITKDPRSANDHPPVANKTRKPSQHSVSSDGPGSSSNPLHLAVQCSKLPTIQLVLSNVPSSYLNSQDRSGQTPLHLACSMGRADVVNLFLGQAQLDDSIKDLEGRTCLEVCKTSEVARLIQTSRAHLSATYLALLSAYIASPITSTVSHSIVTASLDSNPSDEDLRDSHSALSGDLNNHEPAVDQLYRFILRPRSKVIDLNLKEEQSGTTVLHEAARRKDINLIKLAINRGADVLAKDRKNKMPSDVTTDERVKNLFRKAAVSEGRAMKAMSVQRTNWNFENGSSNGTLPFPTPGNHNSGSGAGPNVSIQQPILKGYLSKWTNMARGYSTRWLVLEKGYLSYYRDQKDEGKTVRGSIAMSVATVVGPDVTKDRLRFEVSSKLGNSYPRFYLKGAHPLEVMRWVDALKQAIECANYNANNLQPSISPSMNTPTSRLSSASGMSNNERERLGFVNRHLRNTRTFLSSSGGSGSTTDRNNSLASADTVTTTKGFNRDPDSPHGSILATSFTDDESFRQEGQTLVGGQELELLGQGLKTHIEMTKSLVESLSFSSSSSQLSRITAGSNPKLSPSESSHNSSPSGNNSTTSSQLNKNDNNSASAETQRQEELKQALKRSMEDLTMMLEEYLLKASKREKYYIHKYEGELLAKKLWEENMQALVASHAEIEQQLQVVSRDSSRRKKQLRSLRAGISENNTNLVKESDNKSAVGSMIIVEEDKEQEKKLSPRIEIDSSEATEGLSSQMTPRPTTATTKNRFDELISSSDSEDDSEDEFFEAIETGAISIEPMMTVTKSLIDPITNQIKKDSHIHIPELDIKCIIEGYEKKRTTLPIKADDRPTVSLWAILKNSIGKDLTKITFPVSFNEPTSMLQRVAEDMQFSECLDVACEQTDSLIRMAYVAGFAMSNYSSTVDRLAKPFNPLLGETYEFVEPEKEYRYLSEQISHHPPTSACFVESPRWRYSGECDAKNKFTGKSFEIRPTGIAHLSLYLPKTFEGVENYPEAPFTNGDRVEEHYTWKKVTTVITNLILGSPAIDHYGDMEITNHRTGERCVLTFKPRGWRGKDANEVKGSVFDRKGNLAWELAGKWTTQLIARRAGSATGELAPDQSVPNNQSNLSTSTSLISNKSTSSNHHLRQYLQLWKNEERPGNIPFNLTTFAINLNNINDTLKVWLPPTDCRLRPDQHAFERGAWEKANELKGALEDYQRLTRRKRETGELPKHRPRWFKIVDDEDTGEKTWDVIRVGDEGSKRSGKGKKKEKEELLKLDEVEEGSIREVEEKEENEEEQEELDESQIGRVAYWEERKRVGLRKKSGKVDTQWDRVDHIFGEFELI
ncbi:exodeoxyribonuclease V [Phakopsora pachyrhizi]|nr:exodeoxyribonuclease V [Phakopsora pachyrhizi]